MTDFQALQTGFWFCIGFLCVLLAIRVIDWLLAVGLALFLQANKKRSKNKKL